MFIRIRILKLKWISLFLIKAYKKPTELKMLLEPQLESDYVLSILIYKGMVLCQGFRDS
jgi:hypothetical protein